MYKTTDMMRFFVGRRSSNCPGINYDSDLPLAERVLCVHQIKIKQHAHSVRVTTNSALTGIGIDMVSQSLGLFPCPAILNVDR